MRGPCGARLSRARCGQTGRVIPATLTPREWPACRGMGAHANVAHAQDRRNGPCGPMRGACEARLAWARCGPSGEVIPAARAPRLGPACRCMAGVPAGIAALAAAFVMLLSTTRGHVCSRSGHVTTTFYSSRPKKRSTRSECRWPTRTFGCESVVTSKTFFSRALDLRSTPGGYMYIYIE